LGKDSDAIAAMSVDFPVAPSPTTAILTSLRPLALEGPTIVAKRETMKDTRNFRVVRMGTQCGAAPAGCFFGQMNDSPGIYIFPNNQFQVQTEIMYCNNKKVS